ncbi:MAG: hypothetical protein MUF34_02960 [Polyangiaceae bacterium]|nr:hypothetical protein [Polyangiaceae bacterium]
MIGTARVNDDDLDDLLVYDPATRSVEAWLLTSDGDVSVQPVLADLPTNLEPEGVLRGPEQAELHVDQPIQLRPGVRVLDTDPGFVSASQEGTQITVRYSQTPQLAAPGTMMVGSVEDHAFFGRVMNGFTAAEMPSLGPNDVVYSIESTDLADLILNGSFRYVGAPVAPEVEGSVQTVAQSSQKPPAPNWLDDLGVTCTGESGLRFDITEKSLPPLVSPVFELNMSGGQVQGGKVGLQFGGQAKLQVEASASAAATCVLEPDLKLLRVLRFSHPLPIPIPGVAQAIRVTHSLTPTVRFEAGVSAQLFKVTASVTATLEFQAGFEYKSGAWQGYSAFTAKAEPKFEMPLAQQLALNLSFKLVPYINWTMGIWGLGDRYLPQTTLQYELATQLSAAASGCWEGKVEHKLDLGVAWRLPYFNPLIAGCDPNAAHVPDSPVWNGASSPQLPDCRCSQWVHKEFDLFWASEYPAWQLASNDGRDPSRHRAAALDWYLNGRCVDAEVSLGRFPEFTQVGVPYLNVQTPPGTDGGDWSALVNKAWLAGNMNRGGRIYLATSPRSKRAYYKSPPGKPDEFTAARTVTYDEFDQLRRNGYALEELSNRDACLATVADQNANGQPQPLPPANAKCGVATRNVFFDKALGVAQFKKNLFEATLWRGSGSFLGAQVCASCQLSAPKPTVLCAEENAPSLRFRLAAADNTAGASGSGAAGSASGAAGSTNGSADNGAGGAGTAPVLAYDEVCAATTQALYRTSIGKVLEVSPLDNATVGDDDWYVNAWMSGVESSYGDAKADVSFEIPTDCPGPSGSPTEGSTGGPTLAYVPSRLEPYEPFGFSRYYTPITGGDARSALPKIKVSANRPGRYTITYLLRNARRSRVLGRFEVEVGTWRGIWQYTGTYESYTFGAGSFWCCEWTQPHTGSGCASRTVGIVSYQALELGSDIAPRPVTVGVKRQGNRQGCPYESTTEPPNAEVFSLQVDNFYSINNGSGAARVDGAMLCTGWDNGLPASSWATCAAQSTTSSPGTSSCISEWQCF